MKFRFEEIKTFAYYTASGIILTMIRKIIQMAWFCLLLINPRREEDSAQSCQHHQVLEIFPNKALSTPCPFWSPTLHLTH